MLFAIYWVLGFLAVARMVSVKENLTKTWDAVFLNRLILGLLFGWYFIPCALISLFARQNNNCAYNGQLTAK